MSRRVGPREAALRASREARVNGTSLVAAATSSQALADYDPVKGLKKLATAEVAAKYFARAKDSTRLFEALEAKLTEQRLFVLWWDAQEKDKGGGDVRNTANRSVTGVISAKQLPIDLMTLSRWRKRLGHDAGFSEALARAQERCIKIAEFRKGVSEDVHASSESPNWNTPPHIVDAVIATLGAIDLDPCSNTGTPNIPAARHFTEADDGLTQDWTGRVYMNPPYGDVIPEWTGKLVREFRHSHVTEAVALVPARTDTKWFADLYDCAICFISGRLHFSDSDTGAPFPSAAVYFGIDAKQFAAAFAELGNVMVRYE